MNLMPTIISWYLFLLSMTAKSKTLSCRAVEIELAFTHFSKLKYNVIFTFHKFIFSIL